MARAKTRRAKQKTKLDPITLAVLHKRFDAVTTKMANTLLRTGRSGVLNLARDFSTSVVTRECELLTGAESLPIHHLSGADLMARSMMDLHPNSNAATPISTTRPTTAARTRRTTPSSCPSSTSGASTSSPCG